MKIYWFLLCRDRIITVSKYGHGKGTVSVHFNVLSLKKLKKSRNVRVVPGIRDPMKMVSAAQKITMAE
jgi:hypothetical protein